MGGCSRDAHGTGGRLHEDPSDFHGPTRRPGAPSPSPAPPHPPYSTRCQGMLEAGEDDEEEEPGPYGRRLLCEARHDAAAGAPCPSPHAAREAFVSRWRQKERLKTTAVALVVCLNIGVDPPDVVRVSPCARTECWIDPHSMPAAKALDAIGPRGTPGDLDKSTGLFILGFLLWAGACMRECMRACVGGREGGEERVFAAPGLVL